MKFHAIPKNHNLALVQVGPELHLCVKSCNRQDNVSLLTPSALNFSEFQFQIERLQTELAEALVQGKKIFAVAEV